MSRLAVVVVLLHAGAWTIHSSPAQTFAALGGRAWERIGEVVTPGYPRGVGVVPAERYMVRYAARLRRRRVRVVAVGESAGATLALWLAAHDDVDAAVDVAGIADLTRWRYSVRVGLPSRRAQAAASPLFAWRRGRSAPIWVAGSPQDATVPFAQDMAMARRARTVVHRLSGPHLYDSSWIPQAVGWAWRLLNMKLGAA